jgi:hypothetical protein
MRIISNFRDYYDGGAVFGIDKSVVWVRERKEILLPEADHRKYSHFDGVLGFCGKIFPFMRSGDGGQITFGDDVKRFQYKPIRQYGAYPSMSWELEERSAFDYWRKDIVNQYDAIVASAELQSFFIKYQTPIFVIVIRSGMAMLTNRQPELIINPTLKNYQFFRLYDVTQTFQEIEMFRSNVLVSETMTAPPRTDEEIGTSKGFDRESFRNSKKKSKKF